MENRCRRDPGDSIADSRGSTTSVSASGESELIAQELSGLGQKLNEFEIRLTEVEKVNARLEVAALTTARALQEVSQHWDAVYEAMRRIEEPGVSELRRERDSSRSPPERKS
jgi:predicted nuclease with TOPRIM domain